MITMKNKKQTDYPVCFFLFSIGTVLFENNAWPHLKKWHKKIILAYTYIEWGECYMEYVSYDTKFNKSEFDKENGTSRLVCKMKKHKIITMAGVAFVVFSTLNFVMIYNFMKILQNVWNMIKYCYIKI